MQPRARPVNCQDCAPTGRPRLELEMARKRVVCQSDSLCERPPSARSSESISFRNGPCQFSELNRTLTRRGESASRGGRGISTENASYTTLTPFPGSPTGDVKIAAFIGNGNHGKVSNQFAGVGVLSGNLGSPGAINLANIAGYQFVSVGTPSADFVRNDRRFLSRHRWPTQTTTVTPMATFSSPGSAS